MRLAIALELAERFEVEGTNLILKSESGEEKFRIRFRTCDLSALEALAYNLTLAAIACRQEVPSLSVNLEQYEARVARALEAGLAGTAQAQDLLRLSLLVVRELRAVRAGLRR